MDMSIEIAGVNFQNPLIVASGIIGASASLAIKAFESGAGGIVTKSTSLKARNGYPGPNVVGTPSGIINAMGLPNPGVKELIKELEILKTYRIPVLGSVYGFSSKEYAQTARLLIEAGADGVELNLSCPTVHGTGIEIGSTPSTVEEVVKNTRKAVGDAVVIAKLTPNVTNITSIGKAAEKGGADAVTAINTIKAMAIHVQLERPVLYPKIGGLSGPAIRPIAVRSVYELYTTLKIPILGCGGITSWSDVVEFLLAGASAVQIGTGVLYKDFNIFDDILKGLKRYLDIKGIDDIRSLIGKVHQSPP